MALAHVPSTSKFACAGSCAAITTSTHGPARLIKTCITSRLHLWVMIRNSPSPRHCYTRNLPSQHHARKANPLTVLNERRNGGIKPFGQVNQRREFSQTSIYCNCHTIRATLRYSHANVIRLHAILYASLIAEFGNEINDLIHDKTGHFKNCRAGAVQTDCRRDVAGRDATDGGNLHTGART